jgi:hypothetical protein
MPVRHANGSWPFQAWPYSRRSLPMTQSPATDLRNTNHLTLDVQRSEPLPKPGAVQPSAVVTGTYNLFGWWIMFNELAVPGSNTFTHPLPANQYYIASAFPTEINPDNNTPHYGNAVFDIQSVQLDYGGSLRVIFNLDWDNPDGSSDLPAGLMVILGYIP